MNNIPDEWFSDEEISKNIKRAERTNGLAGKILDNPDICVMSKVRGLALLSCDWNITLEDVIDMDKEVKPNKPKGVFD